MADVTEIEMGITVEFITDPDEVRPSTDKWLKHSGAKTRRKSRAKEPKKRPAFVISSRLFEEIHAEAEQSLFIRSKFPVVERDSEDLSPIRQVKNPKLTLIMLKELKSGFGEELDWGPEYIACIVVAIDTRYDQLLLDQKEYCEDFPGLGLYKDPLYPEMIGRVYDLVPR